MGSLYLWGYSIQEMDNDVVIGRSIYGVVVIDGSLCSRFYGISNTLCSCVPCLYGNLSPCAASYNGLDIQCCVNYVQTEIIKSPVVCLEYVA